jgi:hypothetical protein
VCSASLSIVGRLADAIGVDPAELVRLASPVSPDLQPPSSNPPTVHKSPVQSAVDMHGIPRLSVYQDKGISGAKGRDKRPGLDAMLKDANRRQFDQVAVWGVDRLGRSMSDLVRTLDDLKAAGIDLYLHGQGLDTSTPTGKALFGMLGVLPSSSAV